MRLAQTGVLFVFLFLAAGPVLAQMGPGRVAGTIADERGRPIKGATVTLENENYFPSSLTSATDAKGRFGVIGLRNAVYNVVIRAEGYQTATVTLPVRTAQPNPPLNVRLPEIPEPAPPPLLAHVDAAALQQDLDAAAGLAAVGKTDDAIAAYRRILKDTPALTSVNLQLGILYERQSDRSSAIAVYEAALRADPESTTAREALARLKQ